MKGMHLLSCIWFACVVSGCASAPLNTSNTDSSCLDWERDRYEAMLAAEFSSLDSMLDDSLVFIHASGRTDTKQSFMERLISGDLQYKRLDLVSPEFKRFEGACIVAGKSDLDIIVSGNARSISLMFTSVWVPIDGGWRLTAYQSTFAP